MVPWDVLYKRTDALSRASQHPPPKVKRAPFFLHPCKLSRSRVPAVFSNVFVPNVTNTPDLCMEAWKKDERGVRREENTAT